LGKIQSSKYGKQQGTVHVFVWCSWLSVLGKRWLEKWWGYICWED